MDRQAAAADVASTLASSVPTCRCGEWDFSPNVEAFELTGELVCEDCADAAISERDDGASVQALADARSDALNAAWRAVDACGGTGAHPEYDRALSDVSEALVRLGARDPDPILGGLRAALKSAEAFIAGFEGDAQQPGVDALLADIRVAIATAEGRS